MESDAYIALGSNQGDRELNLLRAVAELGKLPSSKVTGLSSFYETSPVGVVSQPAFFNAVLRLSTGLSPEALFAQLLRIENEVFKRKRLIHWGPRIIDLDLLFYGSQVIVSERLTVPHPLICERRFVLQPLYDIAPDLMHPCGKSVAELLQALQSDEVVTRI